MVTKHLLYLLLLSFVSVVLLSCSIDEEDGRSKDALILDQIGMLDNVSESIEKQLFFIRDTYQIEVVLTLLPKTGNQETIKELSARLFTKWDIGRNYDGRGLLLVLVDDEKAVRVEVGSSLEGIFTDLFTGHIENKQLKSYYLSNQLEIGLVAVIEEIEARAHLLANEEAVDEKIKRLDLKFLSAGGGADVELTKYEATEVASAKGKYSAANTPDQAWQTLIQSWREKNRDPDIGIYTPITRLIYRAYVNQPDTRFEEDVRVWGNKPYEIIKNNDYAVVFFGKKKGWNNAPFLFSRTNEGWQFDMVHQRKIVRMGGSPYWGIERGTHPYINLLSRCPYWMGQDIPWQEDDVYDINNDNITAQRILTLEKQLKANGDDFNTLFEVGKLYTITSLGQQRITLLNRAKQLRPDNPLVLKYLAIAHVDAHYQYNTALELMDNYVNLLPKDPFGHFYRGYLLMMLNKPEEAIKSFEAGLLLEPESIYGMSKLARAYLARGEENDIHQANKIIEQLTQIAPNHIRLKWLKSDHNIDN